MFLLRLVQALEEEGVPYAITGGYAVALHGAVRGTLDVDLVIPQTEEAYVRAEAALQSIGLAGRLTLSAKEMFRFREDYIHKKNMFAWSFINQQRPSELVDIIIVQDLRNLKVRTVSYGRQRIKIVAIEDLIRIKEKTRRAQDRADVQALHRIRNKKSKKKR